MAKMRILVGNASFWKQKFPSIEWVEGDTAVELVTEPKAAVEEAERLFAQIRQQDMKPMAIGGEAGPREMRNFADRDPDQDIIFVPEVRGG